MISVIRLKFFPPRVLCAPAEGVPLELGTGAVDQKTRMMGLSDQERIFTISSTVWIQSINVTDGQTDGHRATAKAALTHSVARYKDWLQAQRKWHPVFLQLFCQCLKILRELLRISTACDKVVHQQRQFYRNFKCLKRFKNFDVVYNKVL